jgi:predicted transcriptional regulator
MNATISVKLKTSVAKRVEQKTKELKINTDALINKALEDYFYFERLNTIRQELKRKAQAAGIEDEDALFEVIS